MEDKQKICCTVESCKYNDPQASLCTLKEIMVTPTEDCCSKQPDESMCSSYEFYKN